MKPISYHNYVIGVPFSGSYKELINSEKDIYSGCNMCNFKPIRSKKGKAHGLTDTLTIDIAPYAGIIFITKNKKKAAIVEEPHTRKRTRDAG